MSEEKTDTERLREALTHAHETKNLLVEKTGEIWNNYEYIAGVYTGEEHIRAKAMAKAFRQMHYAIMKLNFVPED